MNIFDRIIRKESSVAVVGLGYVGLPLALAFARHVRVIGFDIDAARVDMLGAGTDATGEIPPDGFEGCDIVFTSSPELLSDASFYIITVPTPVDGHNKPDLSPLLSATRTVGRAMCPGDYVVYESTVYPGCTEEVCVPELERQSGLVAGESFKFGYSPERVNPGDRKHTLRDTVKVVAGCDAVALCEIERVYGLVAESGVYRTSGVKVAEAAKVIENIQRDVNIALMNELSIIFSRIGINTYEVLEAAGTKWNFHKYQPGLVGGHCIGVDPYYLEYKANALRYHSQLISAGRFINDSMGGYIAKRVVKKIISDGRTLHDSRILVMGVTFKENVSDIRNTKVMDIVSELSDYGISVDIVDPLADAALFARYYGLRLSGSPGQGYDVVIVAVAHACYRELDEDYFTRILCPGGLLADVKGIYRDRIHNLRYWSL